MATDEHGQELQGNTQCNEQDERPDFMLATVRAWRADSIYITKCVKTINEKISVKNCVCAIGVPGCGKSHAIHHVALSLGTEGFIIYFISGPEEFLRYYNNGKKQVFVIDDALGVYSISQSKVDLWLEHNENIKHALGSHPSNTKLLVSIRTQIVMHETVRMKNIVFLDKSQTTDHVNFGDTDYKMGIDEMRGMLAHCMTIKGVNTDDINEMLTKLWPYCEEVLTEMSENGKECDTSRYTAGLEFLEFPLLCKVFVNSDLVAQTPEAYFRNPFQALEKIFHNIKTDNKCHFCALVLCTLFDGKLTSDISSPLSESPLCEEKHKLDEHKILLRNYIMTTYKLKCPENLEDIQAALKSLTGVYISNIEGVYRISHTVFHDIVTYVCNDPLIVFKCGTSEFIRDRIRINASPLHDRYTIVYSDDTNIDRLVNRLIQDFISDTERGAKFIIDNPNIDDERVISCMRSKLSDREKVDRETVDELFRQCMWAVMCNNKDNDATLYKLIELCVHSGADCNMYLVGGYPLHISIEAGNLQLTEMFLKNGADKRRVDGGHSVLHTACIDTKCNKLELIKLLTQHGGDQSVVKFITSDKDKILEKLKRDNDRRISLQKVRDGSDNPKLHVLSDDSDDGEDSDNLQLEEVLPDNSIKVLTTEKHKIKQYLKRHAGKLQLVRYLHDNILTYAPQDKFWGTNILHWSSDDIDITRYLLGLPNIQPAINQRDSEGRTPYWYVVHRKHPYQYEMDISDKDRSGMIILYNKNRAVL